MGLREMVEEKTFNGSTRKQSLYIYNLQFVHFIQHFSSTVSPSSEKDAKSPEHVKLLRGE